MTLLMAFTRWLAAGADLAAFPLPGAAQSPACSSACPGSCGPRACNGNGKTWAVSPHKAKCAGFGLFSASSPSDATLLAATSCVHRSPLWL